MLEVTLKRALYDHLLRGTEMAPDEKKDTERKDDLFDLDGQFGSFSARISMGLVSGLIDLETYTC